VNRAKLLLLLLERLILGVPRPDNPPMDITLRANAYEGVTADIVGMLTHLLHIEILVKGYPSRAAAIEALQRGEIDLLSTSNSYEREQHLLLTDKYIADDPAIYKNIQVKEREIRTIAVPEYYLPFMDIMRYLSDYKIKIYPSRYSALSAVAYGQVDAVMVDMISGRSGDSRGSWISRWGRSSRASGRKWPSAGMGGASPSVPAEST